MLVGRCVAATARQQFTRQAPRQLYRPAFAPVQAQWKGYATTPEAEKVAKFKGQKGSDVRRREKNVKEGEPWLM
ncbi:NAD-dependent isocitrate dehydrogenase [Friedmanniomyces endolithicus]|uniref:NAD-dependent isocitrate dehydrogenase n=1 Tax=Friedmanniomyces endolithicus TaxID=329885 RepID=A0AAN6QUN2_9PEZI|nr:NAD-dependent isocitrate dehydrogenase [Friedmanniomyces endolithicus]KAK0776924.1 NAD-dependent isocitrate dehydrogenase [Friedmanniomyces endolithicus]KAK0782321.1 NAD-dependent isocitrate dehydrogenase [Friedmanniomyces endolithicus]KAK0787253.1 NAD-dependent isocitrate dehydrogenase [Friedmanniomyces endolithicus]KAK0849336.1 NAD-dependent isocitrate dehydrogenase [Friedmanniomyces endolithicus]